MAIAMAGHDQGTTETFKSVTLLIYRIKDLSMYVHLKIRTKPQGHKEYSILGGFENNLKLLGIMIRDYDMSAKAALTHLFNGYLC